MKNDPLQIQQDIISLFEESMGETLYPTDERRIFLQSLLPIIFAQQALMEDYQQQNFLRYARGSSLDSLGDLLNVKRFTATKAKCKTRFTLSNAQTTDITIPMGTRVTCDLLLYFETMEDLVIPSGNIYGEVLCGAEEFGDNFNDLLPGQIKILVDQLPFIQSIANIETTYGGADTESDEDFRQRIRMASQSFSTAGPEGAYRYWALSVDNSICDVSVSSPSPGSVQVVVLQENGHIPDQPILDKVFEAVNQRDRRPLTDHVSVVAPEVVLYDIELVYYITKERQTEEISIRNNIEGTDGAVNQYINWQSSILGREINPDVLRKLLLDNGAYRIELTKPSFTSITKDKVAKINVKNISYGGVIG